MKRDLYTNGSYNKNSNAFTLVELSIVVVIVGLIISAVTAGKSLIKSSKMQQAIADLKKYDIAFTTFKMQYQGQPGDLINAESFWGTYNATTNPTGVQNGNGDRGICCTDSTHAESIQSLAHLSKAKLIPGLYTGQPVAASAVIGTTHPSMSYEDPCITRFTGVII